MKNKIKLLFLLFSIIFLTGCSGNYNIKINEDLSVDEDLYLTIENGPNVYNNTLKIFDDNNINTDNYSVVLSGDEIVIEYKDNFSSIDDYILDSKIYHQLVDNISYNKTDNYIDIYTNQILKLKGNDEIGNTSDLDVIQVNITTPFKVVFDNSDISNDNTYTWTIDKNTINKKIMINFEPKLSGFQYSRLIILLTFILVIGIFIYILFKRYKNIQKI